MRTRAEQVQAYRFVTRRIVSALLSGEPETTERPMRRFGLAVFASSMLAAIVFAAIGVYGFINPAGGKLADNAIVVERETGARFIFREGRLYPVLNFTSARLIAADPAAKVQTLSRRSLRGIERGRPVGIANAPDSLPDSKALLGPPWSVCSTPRAENSTAVASQVLVGAAPDGGAALDGDAILVSLGTAADASKYLLWNDTRLRIRGDNPLAVLELTAITPTPVGEALLNSVAAGPDILSTPEVPNRGDPSGKLVDGQPDKIGSLYRTENQHYVLLADGLSPIGEVTSKLLERTAGAPRQISASVAARVLSRMPSIEPRGFPDKMPPVRQIEAEMVCTVFDAAPDRAEDPLRIQVYDRVDSRLLAGLAEVPNPGRGRDDVRLAHRTIVPGGRGALVREMPAPNAPAVETTVYLITDQGIRYALPEVADLDVAAVLGYPGVAPLPIPKSMLALIPTGPVLDPAAAQRFVGVPAAPATPSPPSGSPRPSATATPTPNQSR